MDRYTKIVLTVIAVALSAIAIEHGVNPAYAQSGLQKVQVCNAAGNDCINVVSGAITAYPH